MKFCEFLSGLSNLFLAALLAFDDKKMNNHGDKIVFALLLVYVYG